MELRHTNSKVTVETRDGKPKVIHGYGAVFYDPEDSGTEYDLFDGAVERIDRNAFDAALDESHDARGLFNHDSSAVLGRVSSGTMRLSVDEVGLRYEITLPETQLALDVANLIGRGDITGSSFAFVPTVVEWAEQENGPDVRTIKDLELYDTGPVTFPAYESATTGVRANGTVASAQDEYSAWLDTLRAERQAKRRGRADKILRKIELDSGNDDIRDRAEKILRVLDLDTE